MAGNTGPSVRAVCRIINRNSCGSGSICGHSHDGESYILTNAHVAGTNVGRVVQVDVESIGRRIEAEVVRSAYSNQVIADWALLKTRGGFQEIEPVYLSKKPPSGSHYTKGFPRCQPHNGTDITTHAVRNNGVWLWLPDAIGGQSGSGVWSDSDNFQYGLLTWSWTDRGRSYGAGQLTSEIYKQNRAGRIVGYERHPDLVELGWDFTGIDRHGCDDPEVRPGFHAGERREAGIQDYPIWAEDREPPDEPPNDPGPSDPGWRNHQIEYYRRLEETYRDLREKLEVDDTTLPPNKNGSGETFGL